MVLGDLPAEGGGDLTKKKIKEIPRVPVETLTCFGKVPHQDIITAIAARDRLTIKVPGVRFRVYNCKHCGEYHIGHINDKDLQ